MNMPREMGSNPDTVVLSGGQYEGLTGQIVSRVDNGVTLHLEVSLDNGEKVGFTTLGDNRESAMSKIAREIGS